MTSEPCYSIVRKPKGFEAANEITLKRRIEGSNWEKCQYALEDLLQNLLDGDRFPSNLLMPVINRYQMNKFSGDVGNQDKRIKKLLYILWECLPKRGPDGKFLDRLVMVCGAFDNDLKHPNEFVCGSVCRTLGKTREPEVMRELVHSIEKCLKLTHTYRQKNAVLAIAKIYQNFPDLNPSAPKMIADYLMEAKDDECKRAALQALLEIGPDEARPYLHSSNIQDMHIMNASIQLLFVEIIQKIFKNCSEDESRDYVNILTNLIKLSTSPSVRYQAASSLMRFSRDPETINLVASCFIDICSKDSDNNVKLIALDSLMKLRRINGADRVIRGSIMDILFILQSATDVELQEKILKLSFDLVSHLNVGGMVAALKQELERNASNPEKAQYRRLLVRAAHDVAERFPRAVIEHDLLDTLFNLLMNNSMGERLASELILLFKVFMTKNPSHVPIVLEKLQDCFNLINKCPATHRGLIQLLGEFSETKEQIERTYQVFKDSLGELPIVGYELRRKVQLEDETSGKTTDANQNRKNPSANGDVDMVTKGMKHLVTADGSYAAQSGIDYQQSVRIDDGDHPPLRHYYLDNKYDTASILCFAILKMASRYQQLSDVSRVDSGKMIAKFMFVIAAILNLGHSNLTDSEGNKLHINNDHTENLMLGLKILQHIQSDNQSEISRLMKRIVTSDIRSQLSLAVKNVDKEFMQDSFKAKQRTTMVDDAIKITFMTSQEDKIDPEDLKDEQDLTHIAMPDVFNDIPLTGTVDAIYAYCVFDAGQYDVGLNIHLENRTPHTLENVNLQLLARGDNASNSISRPDPIVLAPRATARLTSNIKVVSAENRRLFGSITFEDTSRVGTDDREQVIMLNDISVNITDYIRPASLNYDEFREVWRDCEWENKVAVKTTLSNMKDYLMLLVTATNMRCVTAERCLKGECMFLSANMYARSAFGEEALVNISIEKETPQSNISGTVKIRSRSQGMALSLGDKITMAQSEQQAP